MNPPPEPLFSRFSRPKFLSLLSLSQDTTSLIWYIVYRGEKKRDETQAYSTCIIHIYTCGVRMHACMRSSGVLH